jgi:hypothetical protein
MELLRLRLPGNDGLQSNTSQYVPRPIETASLAAVLNPQTWNEDIILEML